MENNERLDREVEVVVSVTLSKVFKLRSSDYTEEIEKNEDGSTTIYHNFNDLKTLVEDNIILPQDAYKYIDPMTLHTKLLAKEDLKGWNVDDFEVIQDN